MIDLLEKTENDGWKRVATATLEDVLQIGVRTFFKVQELTGRKIVYVREEGDETQDQ